MNLKFAFERLVNPLTCSLVYVLNETGYRFDVCRITIWAHTEIRKVTIKTLRVIVFVLHILLLRMAFIFSEYICKNVKIIYKFINTLYI
jgi:hypothetical protein